MLEEYISRNRVRLGLLPTRRNLSRKNFFFKGDAAVEKEKIENKLKAVGVDFVDIDFLNDEGIIFDGNDAQKAAKHFIEAGVDAVFAPHCNFGTEDAVARVAQLVNRPLLLWGPRDDSPLPDGSRLRDSQCGLFATSKVLSQFGVPFSYIPNCRLDDPLFDKCFSSFISSAAVVKSLRHLRIGQIGTRPGAFWTVKYNEEELLHRFGIEIVPIDAADVAKLMDDLAKSRPALVREAVEDIRSRIGRIEVDDGALGRIAQLKLAVKSWADAEGLSAVSFLCGGYARELMGIVPCFAMSELTDLGLPTICETDIHGAVTSVMSQAAVQGSTPTFLADLTVRHPENDNAELLWHCGVFPHSLKAEGCISVLNGHYGSGVPGAAQWEIKGGDVTVSRFDGVGGEYRLLIAEGKGVNGPKNKGTYLWVEFKDWLKLEHRLIYGPYIHHCTGVHARIAPALFEACRYIPGLEPDPVDPTKEELEDFFITAIP